MADFRAASNRVRNWGRWGEDDELGTLKLHHPRACRRREVRYSDAGWRYITVPQADTNGRVHGWPFGRLVGGSTTLNGMIWTRGAIWDYDGWAEMGDRGGTPALSTRSSSGWRTSRRVTRSFTGPAVPCGSTRSPRSTR